MLIRFISLALVAVVGMFSCRTPRTQFDRASATPAYPAVGIFSEIFRDFDYLGTRPITYKYFSDSKRTYPLADWEPIAQQDKSEPFPSSLQSGQRYFLRTGKLQGDVFYRDLEKRFQDQHFETRLFIPHSVMAVVYDPVIPVRFVDKPPLVLQPISLIFHGNGYEGLVVLDEASQVSTKRPLAETNVHDYSLIIFKGPT
jgi:hypothetical protein